MFCFIFRSSGAFPSSQHLEALQSCRINLKKRFWQWIWRREKGMTMDDRWWPEDSRNSEVFWGFGMPLFLAAWKSLFAAAWLQLSALKSMTKLAYTGWPEYHHHLRWKASEISGMSPTSKTSGCISTHKAQSVSHVDPLLLQPQNCEVVRYQNAWRWKWERLRLVKDPVRIFHATTTSLTLITETKRKAGATLQLSRASYILQGSVPLKYFLPSCGYLERSPL